MLGIDVTLFHSETSVSDAVSEEYKIPSNTMVILYVARIVGGKLPLVFAKVMQVLDEKGYNFMAFVIGNGYLEVELQAKLKAYGLLNSKVFMMGTISNEKVRNIMSVAQIIFLPTEVEGNR